MSGKPFVVGIAGGTCSGKSTLIDRLRDKLSADCTVAVIKMDAYYKRPGITTIAPITRIEYAEHNHPDALRMADIRTDLRAAIADTSNDVVLIEGLFCLYDDEIRSMLDLKVFLDLQSDERMYRRILRWLDRQSMAEIADRFLDTVRYRHAELVEPSRWHADIVINGTLDANRGLEVLYTFITTQVTK